MLALMLDIRSLSGLAMNVNLRSTTTSDNEKTISILLVVHISLFLSLVVLLFSYNAKSLKNRCSIF